MERNRTEKKTRNRRVILDVFVILLLAASVAGVVFRCFFYERMAQTDRTERVRITFEMVDVYAPVVESLHKGDRIYLEENGALLGTLLSDVREEVTTDTDAAEPEAQTQAAQNGTDEEQTANPYRITNAGGELLTVEGKALNNSFLLDGKTVLALGDEVRLYTDHAVFYAVITAITAAE